MTIKSHLIVGAIGLVSGVVIALWATGAVSSAIGRVNPVNMLGSAVTGDPDYVWTGLHL